MIGFVFPGQGSQAVGMGKSLYDTYPSVKNILEKANQILGYSLTDLCFNGPEDKLKQTQHAQPALFSVSIATFQVLREKGIEPNFVAGHSLGEYSALVTAGALDFESGLKLVAERGRLMGEAGKTAPGTMAAILGMTDEEIRVVCEEISNTAGVVVVANYNCPGQIVISGSVEGVNAAVAKLKEMKKKAIPLPVSGAFHSPLLQNAGEQFTKVLDTVSFNSTVIPVVSNVTAQPSTNAATLKSALARQMTSAVLWESSIRKIVEQGVKVFVEVGTGNVLSGLVKKINKEVVIYQTTDSTVLEATATMLKS
jgi:[acyl-carrier-protein] S-malonyltransferase